MSGASRFLNTINGNINGTATNVTGTVAIANGGTGATTRLGAAKALTDETVATPGFVVGLTDSWGKFGYTSIANLKTTIGSAAAASGGTAITMCTTGEKYTWNNSANTVTQTASLTDSTEYGVLLTSSASDSSNHTEGSRKSQLLTFSSVPGRDNTNQGTLKILNNDGYYTWGMKLSDCDIEIINDEGTSMSWDGTNTSLSNSLRDKLSKTGGTMTGTIITPADDSKGIEPATGNYGYVGSSSKYFYNMYSTNYSGCNLSLYPTLTSTTNSKKLTISSSDIVLGKNGTATADTWDGTNISLKTAITSKLDKSKITTINHSQRYAAATTMTQRYSFSVPAKSVCIATAQQLWNNCIPRCIAIGTGTGGSSLVALNAPGVTSSDTMYGGGHITTTGTIINDTTSAVTYYVYAAAATASSQASNGNDIKLRAVIFEGVL